MENAAKRKRGDQEESRAKKIKGGNWITPNHQSKIDAARGRSLEVGDVGIWVTCQRHKEMRAADEVAILCEEYGQKLFGINAEDPAYDETGDIEASVEKELAALKQASKPKEAPFDIMKMNVDCLLFVRTRPPVDPVLLVREIAKDAATTTEKAKWRTRFVNKLSPVVCAGKASENGLEEIARQLLPQHFQMKTNDDDATGDKEEQLCSYAIRPNIRLHQPLARNDVIEKVAKMISKKHKVNLETPDKVIIIEIFQSFCGMSVVGKDWEVMKRYNIHELYSSALKAKKAGEKNDGRHFPNEAKTQKDSVTVQVVRL
ncbi:hypothetical protein F5Y16DRAFT_169242 [Xylariaceae sp. FL0255]|nr:hypothetical protein F5Y16DRAFT_169242 [Xylariaceae sp. FL0255]